MASGLNRTSTRRPTRSKLSSSMPGLASACLISAASSAQSIPATCSRATESADGSELEGLDGGKHFLGVAIDFHAVPSLHDLAVRTDQICGARHAHVLLAVH